MNLRQSRLLRFVLIAPCLGAAAFVSIGAPRRRVVDSRYLLGHGRNFFSDATRGDAIHSKSSSSRRSSFQSSWTLLCSAVQADTTSSSSSSEEASSSTTTPGTLTLFSPCKINLFLRILRKRQDGFHDLASLFQAIGFGDTLELTVLEDKDATMDVFTCNMDGVPTDSRNLVIRALELMRTKTGHSQTYFQANLIKQVPAQAGLGGGSANAATAMWGANELMGRPATLEQV